MSSEETHRNSDLSTQIFTNTSTCQSKATGLQIFSQLSLHPRRQLYSYFTLHTRNSPRTFNQHATQHKHEPRSSSTRLRLLTPSQKIHNTQKIQKSSGKKRPKTPKTSRGEPRFLALTQKTQQVINSLQPRRYHCNTSYLGLDATTQPQATITCRQKNYRGSKTQMAPGPKTSGRAGR